MNIFDCAIKMEEKTKARYEQLEKETSLPEQKHLFSLLASAEEEHIERLVGMKGTVAASEAEVAACPPEDAMRTLVDKERELEKDPDFFLHAVQEEEKDISYYEELAEKVEDAGVRVNLLLLAEEERKHLEVVENIYTFAEAPRSYLAWQEFSNLDEL